MPNTRDPHHDLKPVSVALPPPEPVWKRIITNPLVIKVAVVAAGVAIGAACHLLPPPLQPVCQAAATAWNATTNAVSSQPPQPVATKEDDQ